MAHADGTSARAHRLIALAAALLLAVTTALAFGRVFLGATPTLHLVGAAVAAACLAVAFERRSLLLATVVSGLGLVVAIGLIVFPETTWYGLPTADTLRAALDAAALVGEQARIQPAPAEPIDPLLLAALVSLWAAIFSAHALAFRAGSPLLGLVPPVALVAFADTVLEEFVKPLYGVAFLAAALLVVFADGLARVQGWGPVWGSGTRGVAATAGRGARRLAFTALGAALIAPVIVPGFGSKGLVDFGTPVEDRVAIDPFVSVRASLTQSATVEVLRVTAEQPSYIRLVTAPEFDGAGWRPTEASDGAAVGLGEEFPLPDRGETAPARIEVVSGLLQNYLPAPSPLLSIDGAAGRTVRYDADTSTAFVDRPFDEGDVYTVTTSRPRATAEALRNVGVFTILEGGRYTKVPDDMPDEIETIARDWTANADNVFDKVVAIEQRLSNSGEFRVSGRHVPPGGIEFDPRVPDRDARGFLPAVLGHDGGDAPIDRDPVAGGRGVDHRESGLGGAVLDHHQGRTRVGGGLLPGLGLDAVRAHTGADERRVLRRPRRRDLFGTGLRRTGFPRRPPTNSTQGREATTVENSRPGGGSRAQDFGALPTIDVAEEPPFISARMALLLGAIVVGLVLLLVPPVRAIRRRVRLRRAAAEPRRLILETYEVFTERAAGMGLGRGPGETLDEYRRKVMETGYLSNGHLDRLTRLTTTAAYSQHEPDEQQAQDATSAADTAIREIRRAVGPAAWFVGLYRGRT